VESGAEVVGEVRNIFPPYCLKEGVGGG